MGCVSSSKTSLEEFSLESLEEEELLAAAVAERCRACPGRLLLAHPGHSDKHYANALDALGGKREGNSVGRNRQGAAVVVTG